MELVLAWAWELMVAMGMGADAAFADGGHRHVELMLAWAWELMVAMGMWS